MKNKNTEIKNKIIIVGGSHHNMLGVVRALGTKGIKSSVIITNNKPYSFVAKSKYIESAIITEEDKKKVLSALIAIVKKLEEKAVIIPTSDFAAELIDENYEELKKYCILPSLNEKQGEIVRYMDKFEQYDLAQKHGIKMAKSKIISLDNYDTHDLFRAEKYILKPIISANGSKSDIRICSIRTIDKYFLEFRKKGYDKILVQEYLDFDTECGLIGCSDGKMVVLPGIINKIRIYPQKRGSNSFARIEKLERNLQIEKIKNLLLELKYSGMFDIEIFIKGDDIYLNEINFRNSGNTFAYCYGGVYIVYLWILLALKKETAKDKKAIDEAFAYIDERLELKQLLHRNITLREYLNARKIAKARLLHFRKDIRPSIYKVIYAIRRRIER